MKKTLLLKITSLQQVIAFILLLNFTFTSFSGTAQEGKNDETFNTSDNVASQGTNGNVLISVIQPDNKIIISGYFTSYNGTAANKIARLNTEGKIDKSFNAGSGTDGDIKTITVQPNGKILIGGNFLSYNGTLINRIARLNENGSIDKTFKVGLGADNSISKIMIQPDEKIVVAGAFTKYNNVPAKGLVRLNKNGTVDNTFNAKITDSLLSIHQIAVLSNGKIIITGSARNFFGDMRKYIETIRLNKNGDRDYSFNECKQSFGDSYPFISSIAIENDGNVLLALTNQDFGSSFPYSCTILRVDAQGKVLTQKNSFWINSMIIQADKKIIALGFDNPDWGIIKRRVVRMNKDFSIDSTFKLNDEKEYKDPYECSVQSISRQLDGKLIVGGNFNEINGLIANNIARLNTDGSFDVTFNQRRGCNGAVFALVKQANGRLIIGGEFSRYNYQFMSNIARLRKNGDLDPSFYVGSGTNGKIFTIAIQTDGKILIGGSFTSYNGNNCNNVARLHTDGSFDNTFKNAKTDGIVRKISIAADGKIIIGGDFKNVNGVSHVAVARIQSNGTLDAGFHPFIDDIGCVYDCKIASNGKIYLALNYKNTFEIWIDSKIERLDSDGTEDTTFQIPYALLSKINTLELTADNKLFAGGMGYYREPWFMQPSGIITKLNEDGSADTTFNYKVLEQDLNKEVKTIALISNNKIAVGGDFDANKTYMNHIGLLHADGNVYADFAGSTNANVYSSVITEENKLVIGGLFSTYSTFIRNGIARIVFDANVNLQRASPVQEPLTEQVTLFAYPNPAASAVTIDHIEAGSSIKIYNSSGMEMHQVISRSEKMTIDLSDYDNGIYFLVAENNGKRTTSKFVVSK